jgi:hypothetical protein
VKQPEPDPRTIGPFLDELRATEQELLALATALDVPVPNERFALTVLCIAQRARTLYRAFVELQDSDVRIAGKTLLRTLVELNVLLRFLAHDPDLHVDLWVAEGKRTGWLFMRSAPRYSQVPLSGDGGRDDVGEDDERFWAEQKRQIEAARRRALERGIPGVSRRGAVMPSISQQLAVIRDPAAQVAYDVAYRTLSDEMHGGSAVFSEDQLECSADGASVSYSDWASEEDMRAARALAAATFASLLAITATHLALPILDRADAIRGEIVKRRS